MFPEVTTYIPTALIRRLPEGRMQLPFGDSLVLSIKITPPFIFLESQECVQASMGSELSKGLEGPQAHRLQLSQTIRKPELMME